MNFFKNKPCIANPYDRKLDMVPYFAPLVTLDPKSKIEKQVSLFVDLPNAFFKLVRQPTFQKEISTFQKNLKGHDPNPWFSGITFFSGLALWSLQIKKRSLMGCLFFDADFSTFFHFGR